MTWLHCISPDLHATAYAEHAPSWFEASRVLYDHELVIVTQGSCLLSTPKKLYTCKAGSWIIIPPGQWHETRVTSDTPCTRLCMLFDWNYQATVRNDETPHFTLASHPILEKHLRLAPSYVPSGFLSGYCPDLSAITSMYYRLHERWLFGTTHDQLIARSLALELLLEILDEQHPQQENDTDNALAARARRILQQAVLPHLSGIFSIQTFLTKTGYSYAHVCRVFNKTYGLSPSAYIIQLRMDKAQQLLTETRLPIASVAQQLGFQDPAYFTRFFKKNNGTAPQEFRNKHT